jgi:membrane-bound metal-dependent hydrolase YbcI (DUF457 family)
MPTPVAHSLAGAVVYAVSTRGSKLFKSWRWLLLCMFFAAVADLDFFPGLFGRLDLANQFHRRFIHTLLFAILASTAGYVVLRVLRKQRPVRNSILLFGCASSHILLDMLGKDSREPIGIPFLWPLVRRTFKIPLEIFPDLRKDTYAEMFTFRTVRVIVGEVLLFGAILLVVTALKLRRAARGARGQQDKVLLPEATGKGPSMRYSPSPAATHCSHGDKSGIHQTGEGGDETR